MTKILMIGIEAKALDYSKLPPGLDETTMTALIEAGFSATTAAGFDAVNCLIGTAPEEAETQIRAALNTEHFGLVMIGAGIRIIPDYTELFERIINVCNAEAPGVTFCFNTSLDTTLDALRRHIQV